MDMKYLDALRYDKLDFVMSCCNCQADAASMARIQTFNSGKYDVDEHLKPLKVHMMDLYSRQPPPRKAGRKCFL